MMSENIQVKIYISIKFIHLSNVNIHELNIWKSSNSLDGCIKFHKAYK